MNKKTITVLLKTMIAVLGVLGVVCCFNMPSIVDYIFPGWSPFTQRLWLGIFWVSALPCFVMLIPAWRIAGNIGKNQSFCRANVRHTRLLGVLAAVNTGNLALANLITMANGRSFFAFFLSFFFIVAVFFALSVCAFSFSYLLGNAVTLQEQSDFTI